MLQQMPRAVTVAPPSELITPPLIAVVAVMDEALVVDEITGRVAATPPISLKLTLSVVFIMDVIARLISTPAQVVGVKDPEVKAVPGVVVLPLNGCKYTRM